ncbi:nucleotidyl transferase AbiEii/AbiGii toxin family protein [Puia sp. P3]|uniref:nucleotidyl transferase AbiEii/AbiGii toxin family protein n=1 Tax=Puia sp. P3 TaxID=3423952 RepID=UPI003D67BF40
MNYQISSAQFDDPDMPELLRTLASFFQSREIDFYIVGAVARDIVLGMINKKRVRRKTDDLDIAIMIRDWDTFERVKSALSGLPEFTKSSRQKQRFHYKNHLILDIIPFGEIARADRTIHWPPDETPVMSVAGFVEMAKKALFVTVDNEFTIGVASLPGIFVLKLVAWQDRCRETDKDAQDLALLINEYFDVNFTKIVEGHPDIFRADDFTTLLLALSYWDGMFERYCLRIASF